MAVTQAGLEESFSRIREDVTNKDLIAKCLSLCQRFSLSAGDLTNLWESFAINHDGSKFEMSSWGGFESEVVKAKSSVSMNSNVMSTPSSRRASSSRSNSSSIVTPRSVPRRIIEPVTLSDLRASPLSLGAKRPQATFETPDPKMARLAARARQDKDPGDLSPTSVQSPPDVIPVYANRKNAGQTTASHNPKLGKRGLLASPASTRGAGTRCDIAVDEAVGASAKYRYMYTPLEERAAAMEKGLLALQAQFESRFGLEGVAPVGVPRQEQIVTVGRIFCESAEGKINRASILLEGSRRDSGGQRVHLDLRELLSFAFFPGQVVAVQGVNSSGGRMVARRVIQGVPRPLPASPPAELMRFHHSTEFTGGKALSIFTAAGPFTATDSLVYDPLNDLLRVIAEAKPDVAILTGPFVDSEHPQVASGEASVEYADGGSDPVDFETLFKLRLSDKLQNLFRQNEDLPTQFVLVPSLRDVFHDFVYPQPPFHDRVAGGAKLHADTDAEESFFELNVPCVAGVRKRVHLAPNPAWLRVNEVTIGVTSTDTLKDLSGEEVSAEGTRGNRLARLAGHMLSQQSFYPLFPPPVTSPAQLDMRHAQRWCMPTSPDVLLVPSKLAQFAREVQGCLCVNPGQLAKGTGGGTYAELSIHAIPREVLAKAQEELADKPEATIPHDVAKRACVEIRRI